MKMSIGEGLNVGLNTFKGNLATILIAFVLAMICVGIPLVGFVIGGPVMLGYLKLLVKIRGGAQAEIGDIFEPLKTDFVGSWLAMFIPSLLMFICLIPFLILMYIPVLNLLAIPLLPLISLAMTAFFMIYVSHLALKNTTDWSGSLREALAFLKSDTAAKVIYLVVMLIIGSLGTIALLVGVFFTAPVAHLAILSGIGAEIGVLPPESAAARA